MGQAPVGIRCKECGKAARMPTYDVRSTYYARAVGVAAGVAIGGGIIWAVLIALLGWIPFVSSLIGIGVGYASGELISLSVNRKRSKGLAWLAGAAVLVAFLISAAFLNSWLAVPFRFNLWGLLFIIFGVLLAVQKVRP
jgi:ABC-type transport system involved in multi-copper enzyme maturation permease subunit